MDALSEKLVSHGPLLAIVTIVPIVIYTLTTLHNIYRGPLSHIPGPKIRAFSIIPYVRDLLFGTSVQSTVALHRKYGSVVRLSPTEVSFTSVGDAWGDIYGFRIGKLKGHANMPKDPKWYAGPANGVHSIITADDENHARGRKVLAHAFSERALAAQEELLQGYVDKFIQKLGATIAKGGNDAVVDMTKWYNWITFDLIADLLFGVPFGCLDRLETHEYVELLFNNLQSQTMLATMGYLPFLGPLKRFFYNPELMEKREAYAKWVASKVAERAARDTDRHDFMTDILANNGHKGAKLTDLEINSNASLLITAGSETTATLLSGVTYLLTTHPLALRTLQSEIRDHFANYENITLEAVNRLPYLSAVLNEGLRVFPPVPVGFVRMTGKGGEVVSGQYIPEGTSVSVSQYAANHSEENFRDAEEFVPERWLEEHDAKFSDDKKAGLQPFSFGPRACLGRSLAWAEMRLILAKTVWSFDMELQPQSQGWVERCRVQRLWVKPELAVKVTAVAR